MGQKTDLSNIRLIVRPNPIDASLAEVRVQHGLISQHGGRRCEWQLVGFHNFLPHPRGEQGPSEALSTS